jgi:hypothetical protein
VGARHYYQSDTGEMVEVTRILREGWNVKEAAEEGESPMVQIQVNDPFLELFFVGHRRWLVIEDESTGDDDVLYCGYIWRRTVARGTDDNGEPLGRVWKIELNDANTLWGRRVMEGTDCNRAAESDVERVQWLLSTAEAAAFDNVTDFVHTTNPAPMDAVNYVGQMFDDIMNDCAQQSGKNWYVFYRKNGAEREMTAWYGRDADSGYVSPLSVSNDPADWSDADLADGTSLEWPVGDDTELVLDPSRRYSGAHVPYDGGARYVTKPSTATAIGAPRDSVMPAVNVKTADKAIARGRRWLNDMDEEDERITTTVTLPAAIATQCRAGMLLGFKGVHLPGYEDSVSCRILSAAPKPVDAGSRYEIALDLAGPKGLRSAPATGARAVLWMVQGTAPLQFAAPGDTPPAGFPVIPTSALITPGPGGGGPWAYTGWTIGGSGTIDLYLNCPVAGVTVPVPVDVIVELLHNDAVIGSDSRSYSIGLRYIGFSAEITVTGVSVSPGDTITARVRSTAGVAFLGARGIGDLNQRMEITGGSLS